MSNSTPSFPFFLSFTGSCPCFCLEILMLFSQETCAYGMLIDVYVGVDKYPTEE